ncbi:acyl-CoA dehydrogenase [Thermoplasmatales archaeon ex4572_165]|nr:MAG: acyl-CoA dehydrogenase [Thermoplasmatales archaeon ex4572_165]RLF59766.1 MAG: acyl-CoA dehydrogenase [Thermoplasmata archaeon]
MDFSLTEQQKLFKKTIREFCNKEIKPIASKIDQEEYFPEGLYKKMGQMGLMGMTVPQSYGGAGIDRVSYMIALEEISRVCGSTGITVEAHNSLGVGHIYEKGTEEQRKKYLPKLCNGEELAAWALSEPNAGSDASSTQTTAELDGDEWVLNGTKQFITTGDIAWVTTVMAKTDKDKGAKGISAFIVEKDTPGFKVGQLEDKLGLRGSHTAELILEDCRVPKENLLDTQGMGFIGAMNILDRGRTAIGAMSVGIARGSFEDALEYANQRQQFGKPIGKNQAIQWMLADMATDIDAARLLVFRAADMEDKNIRFTKEAAMAKLFASEMAVKATVKGMQILGGYGYTREYPSERYYRDIKLCTIGEGTSEVQRMVIARQLGL